MQPATSGRWLDDWAEKSTDDSLNEPFEQDSTAADDESVLDKFVDDGENGGKKPKSTKEEAVGR